MARSRLLTDEQWGFLLAPPSEELAIVRHCTLSQEDFDLILQKRTAARRLGFAIVLIYLRFPGRALDPHEMPPAELVTFLANQLHVDPAELASYRERDPTRRAHLAQLTGHFGYRSFDRSTFSHYLAWLTPIAQNIRKPERLIEMLLDELRRQRILLPIPRTLELLVHQALNRAELVVYRALTDGLSQQQRETLDSLLDRREGTSTTLMAWLRGAPQAPAARNIVAAIDRLQIVRDIGISADRQKAVPAVAFERLAAECQRMTAQHVKDLRTPRRYAVLVAAVISLETALTDATLFMFDKLVGSLARRAERQTAEKNLQSLRDAQGYLRTLTTACRAIIQARDHAADPVAAIQVTVGWDRFVQCVAEAEGLARPEKTDSRVQLVGKYQTVRTFAPALLEIFNFQGGSSVASLMSAIDVIRELYRTGKRHLPTKPPTGFIRRSWRPFVFIDGEINRRAYEVCALSELRDRLRAGDVWVKQSRQYQDFDNYLIPKETFEILKADGPLPVDVDLDAERYLDSRRAALLNEMDVVATLAETNQLPDVQLNDGDLKITPLKAITPEEVDPVRNAAYDLMPRIKITDLLLEVDRWTGFSDCFVHQRTGRPATEKATLLTALLADGINLGLTGMAEATRGATLRQLAWIHDWHIREETYADALVKLIEAHRAMPLAREWGTGTTSSSDGQFFQAGGRGEALGDINARHGNEPGVAFYTHISDQFSPYYTKVIAATASEAPHVLDGLLYHQTGLQIEEHYTDTGGATDHVFALCHLFGFRFAPRLRDIKDRRLYLFLDQKPRPTLNPLVGGFIDADHVADHWDEVLRLATSIRSGTVTASAMLRKLSSYPRQNGLAVALREIGRIERTLFTLDWLKNVDLRRRAQAGLNKGEARNALARAVFFNRLGEIRDRTFESQVFRASGLNLLVAAIILWNTRYLELALSELHRRGYDVSNDIVKHIAPLGWGHVGLTGDYVWSMNDQPSLGGLRPLRRQESILVA